MWEQEIEETVEGAGLSKRILEEKLTQVHVRTDMHTYT